MALVGLYLCGMLDGTQESKSPAYVQRGKPRVEKEPPVSSSGPKPFARHSFTGSAGGIKPKVLGLEASHPMLPLKCIF